MAGSREGAGYTAVEYRHLRSAILSSQARRKVVVLDCCARHAPEPLDLETVYRAVDHRLGARNRPRPQRSRENDVGRLPLVRNRARASRRAPAGPVIDAEVEAAMSGTPDRQAIEVLESAFRLTHRRFGPEAVTGCRRLAVPLQSAGSHSQACEVLRHALDTLERGTRSR
ncbi:hypothetical protein ACFZDK_15340 [Streptomyces sp. NPDC007901]|uniref:hypothetical protein n=1 Tax=Streptomyces sp. NPDC007901 TaxID=3364785 RepID=UPI0036E331FA